MSEDRPVAVTVGVDIGGTKIAASLVTALDLDAVVLGGGVAQIGAGLLAWQATTAQNGDVRLKSEDMDLSDLLERISGTLIVSCQAPNGHALRDTATMRRMARAAVAGGASAIRCGGVGGVDDIAAALRAALPDVPIVAEGRSHTPDDVAAAVTAGAVAVVVGTAITDPTSITGRFAGALGG